MDIIKGNIQRGYVFEWTIIEPPLKSMFVTAGDFIRSPAFWACGGEWTVIVQEHYRFQLYASVFLKNRTGEDNLISATFLFGENLNEVLGTDINEDYRARPGSTYFKKEELFNVNRNWKMYILCTFCESSKEVSTQTSKIYDNFSPICSKLDLLDLKTPYEDSFGSGLGTLDVANISKLSKDFENILLNGKGSDVKIKVEAKEFLVHKAILSARCPVFSSMFEHETAENKNGFVDITDCDADSFDQFLRFIYTGYADTTVCNIFSLYKIADKYCITHLKNICRNTMLRQLEIDSICDVLDLAITHEEKELLEAAIDFFVTKATEILVTEKWRKFNRDKTDMASDVLGQMATRSVISLKLKVKKMIWNNIS